MEILLGTQGLADSRAYVTVVAEHLERLGHEVRVFSAEQLTSPEELRVVGVERGLPLVTRRVPKLPPEPFRRLGGGLVRASIMACEEAEEQGRRGSLPARAGAALPRLLGMSVGTR